MTAKEYIVKRLVSKLYGGGTANRVVATTDGSAMAMQQIVDAFVSDSAAVRQDKTATWMMGNRMPGTQSITTGAAQPISWTTASNLSTPSGQTALHETVTNPTRITFPKAGVIFLAAEASFHTDYTNVPYIGVRKNGLGVSGLSVVAPVATASLGGWTTVQINVAGVVAANDYVEITAGHFAGGSVDIGDNGNQHTVVLAVFVGGL